jgi:hypothetical protein
VSLWGAKKLALASPTVGGCSVGVVRSRTEATGFIFIYEYDRLCGLVVRVPGYRMEMYCAFCEVRTEFIYVI